MIISLPTAVLLSLLLAPVGATGGQQLPPRDAKPASAAGTGLIRGIVVDEPSGLPLAGARVLIEPLHRTGLAHRSWHREVGGDGRFEASGLPPGDYIVSADGGEFRSIHLGRTYGSDPTNPASIPRPLALAAGERRELTIVLPRAVAIEGRVVNEAGEPMADIAVTARAGRRTRGPDLPTDDRGQFRIFGLEAGTYAVCAQPPARTEAMIPASEEARRQAYRRICSLPVNVSRTSPTPYVLLRMEPTPAVTISGTVTSATGLDASAASVNIRRLDDDGTNESVPVTARSGTFEAARLAPGQYTLQAAIGRAERGTGAREKGTVTIRVEGVDVSGIVIRTTPAETVPGRVRSPGQRLPAGARVNAVPDLQANRAFSQSPVSAAIGAGGEFTLEELHGEYAIRVTGLPPDWCVEAVRDGEADVTNHPLTVPRRERRPLEIVVRDTAARLTVRPVSAAGELEPALVLLLPASREVKRVPIEPLPWRNGFGGITEFVSLKPGEYIVVAVPPGDFFPFGGDPAIIERLAAAGRKIVLGERAELSIDVPLTRLDGGK